MKYIIYIIIFFSINTFADRLASVDLETMTNDSDIIILGHSKEINRIKNGLIYIDEDNVNEKHYIDVLLIKFQIKEILKGSKSSTVYLCTFDDKYNYVDIKINKNYIIFAKKTPRYLMLTHRSMSQIEVENEKVIKHFFYYKNTIPVNLGDLKEKIFYFSTKHNKKILVSPSITYDDFGSKALKNYCDGRR
jgi:hypothetical protein